MRLLHLAAVASLAVSLTACGDDVDPTATPGLSPGSTPSAAASAAPPVTGEPPEQPSSAPAADSARLTGDGLDLGGDVLIFGTAADQAVPVLRDVLGEPTKDTGDMEPFSSYGTCPGTTLRVLEYGGGALQLLFGDIDSDEPVLYGWALTSAGDPAAVPKASAVVGDEATFPFGVGTTVGEMEEQTAEDAFTISEDELSMDPAFTLADQSAGFRGFLTGRSPTDTVTFVEAGTPCGQ